MLHPTLRSDGRIVVRLSLEGGGGRNRLVHQLVMFAFVGPYPEGMEICHEDGVASHCWLSNLRYDTPVNNQKDKIRHGTQPRGEEIAKKLNERAVTDILTSKDTPDVVMAERYKVSRSAIFKIRAGKMWAHLQVNR